MATPVSNTVPLSGNPLIDGLTQGSAWRFGDGPRVITYSLSVNDTIGGDGKPYGGTWDQYPGLHTAVDRAFAVWGQYIDVTFHKIDIGSVYNQSNADIAVILTGDELSGDDAIAVALFPDPVLLDGIRSSELPSGGRYLNPEGDIAIDNYVFHPAGEGSIYFTGLLQLIGHALGLKYTWDGGGNNRPTLTSLGAAAYESAEYSIFAPGVPDFLLLSPVVTTPLLLDIFAIQHIYGANQTHRTGDDRYFVENNRNTIVWDAGGIDTIDFSRHFVSGVTFRLEPGYVSVTGGRAVAGIAFGTTIENIVGSPFNDTLHGNGGSNIIEGHGGIDVLFGGQGDDTYVVGNRTVTVRELADEGIDTVIVRGSDFSHVYALPENVENLVVDSLLSSHFLWEGNASANRIEGSGQDNILRGLAGDDTILGHGGGDTLEGGSGADRLEGGTGDDRYIVDALDVVIEAINGGIDLIEADISYTLPGNVERLHLTGVAAIDGVGNELENEIHGNATANRLDGRDGADTLRGFGGDDLILGGAGDDHLYGHEGSDRLEGGHGNDILEGGADADEVFGGPGNDRLISNDGADRLEGGPGDDVYDLSDTRPVVHEGPGNGTDTVIASGDYTLPDYVENLVFDGALGIGNALDNQIIARGSFASEAHGGEGHDELIAQSNGLARLIGGPGNDRLIGNGLDRLEGGQGNDVYEPHSEREYQPEFTLRIEGAPGNSLLDGALREYTEENATLSVYPLFTGSMIPNGIQGALRLPEEPNPAWLFRFAPADEGDQALNVGNYVRSYAPSFPPTSSSIFEPVEVRVLPPNFDLLQLNTSWGRFELAEFRYSLDSRDIPVIDKLVMSYELHLSLDDPGIRGFLSYEAKFPRVIYDEVFELPGEGDDWLIVDAPFAGSNTIDLGSIHFEHARLKGGETIHVIGESGPNVLIGNAADNRLTGLSGDDQLDGGDGIDTAVFTGTQSQYAFLEHDGAVLVADRIADRDGVDTLVRMEQVYFQGDDRSQLLASADTFTALEYIASHDDLMDGFSANPELGLQHFVATGRFDGRHASFHGLEYVASYADLMEGFGVNVEMSTMHYIQSGRFEGRTVSFSGLEYIASYADLMATLDTDSDAGTAHYITTGRFEGRSVQFSGLEYLASYADLMDGYGLNAEAGAAHYIETGRFESRQATFNGLEYLASHLDLMAGFGGNAKLATEHYIGSGRHEGRQVNFDALRYIAAYTDLLLGFGANVELGAGHYIAQGRFEGRTERFDATQYLANYADLQAGFHSDLRAATTHYIEHGFLEGRTDQAL